MPKIAIEKQMPFIVLTALHLFSACIVLGNELLAITNRFPGGNFPIEHKFSWARVLLFCAVGIVSALGICIFTVKKDLGVFLPSLTIVLPVAFFITLISVLSNYPSVSGWCCEVHPTRYYGFPFSYSSGNSLMEALAIPKAGRIVSYRFPYEFFMDLVFWSNSVFIILTSMSFLIQKRKDGKKAWIERPVMDRIIRLLLALFFGLIAGLIAFFFPARPPAALTPAATPFVTSTFPPTPSPIATPNERLITLVHADLAMPELSPTGTPTPTVIAADSCPGTSPVGAAIGQIAMVQLDPSLPSRVHEQPDTASTVLGQLRTGEFFIILDGPQCADGYIWWKAQSARGLLGWIAEGYVSSYWLVTPSPVSTRLVNAPIPSPTPAQALMQPTAVSVAQLHRMLSSDDRLMTVVWSPDGTRLASGGAGGAIQIWDWAQGQQLSVTSIAEIGITSADQSPERIWLRSAGARHLLHNADGDLLTAADTSDKNLFMCRQIKWSPNRRLVAGVCDYGSIFIWDVSTGAPLRKLYGHMQSVTDIAWSPDGQQIASSGSDGTVRIWDVIGGQQMNVYLNNGGACRGISPCGITSIAWSPNGSQIAFSDINPQINTLNLTNGHQESVGFPAYSAEVRAITWSPDGQRLASIDGSGIEVWGLTAGAFSYVLDPGNLNEPYGLAWSPDGKYLAVAGSTHSDSPQGSIWIWSIPGNPTVTPLLTSAPQPTSTATASFIATAQLPTATSTFVSEPTDSPTLVPINTSTPRISKTRLNLSPELYLDENSSPDNLGESNYPDYAYFRNGLVHGYVYHFGTEEWVVAETETCVIPSKDVNCDSYVEGRLRAYYVQVWKDGELVYSVPIKFGDHAHKLLRYEDHWILSFGDDWDNQMRIVQDGILLNDLYDYDTAFSLFLLDGKPFFFFQREDQFGIAFHNEEILLPYSNIIYAPVCCEGGGSRNPDASDTTVGFYAKRVDSDYQYIEVGLR